MDHIYIFIVYMAVAILLWRSGILIGEYAVGHFEGRRNMIPKIPYGGLRKWAYLKGHKRGVKRGR